MDPIKNLHFLNFMEKTFFSFFNGTFYVDFEFRIRNNLHYSLEGEKSLLDPTTSHHSGSEVFYLNMFPPYYTSKRG